MKVVDELVHFPGACAISGAGGPAVDTERWGVGERRLYVSLPIVDDMIDAVGGMRPGAAQRAREELLGYEHLVEMFAELEEEHYRLVAATRETFAQGAVRLDDDSFRLRPKRGVKAPQL